METVVGKNKILLNFKKVPIKISYINLKKESNRKDSVGSVSKLHMVKEILPIF